MTARFRSDLMGSSRWEVFTPRMLVCYSVSVRAFTVIGLFVPELEIDDKVPLVSGLTAPTPKMCRALMTPMPRSSM